LEERKEISISNLLSTLNDNEKLSITKEKVVEMERALLLQLDFDIQVATAFNFLPRFLQLLKLDDGDRIEVGAYNLMLTHLIKNPSSEVRPSVLAAACLFEAA